MALKYNIRFTTGIILKIIVSLVGVFCVTQALAGVGPTLGDIQKSVQTGIGSVAAILQDVALIAGIGFVFASFFKFHQHKMNPQQIPLSQGVTLLVIGAALAVFPHLLNTASQGVFGTGISQATGGAIKTIIGVPS